MSFNIGSQSGGVVNNVAGNQYVTGGQHGVQVSYDDVVDASAALRQILAAGVPLSEVDRVAAGEEAAAIEAELASPEPSRPRVAARLERLTAVLSAAGAFVGAGAALIPALSTIAQWLGPLGASVLQALPIA